MVRIKNLWRITLTLLVLLAFLASGAAALPTDHETSPGIESTQYLTGGISRITNNGNGTVSIIGESYANQIVDQIWVRVYLQKYEGGQWKTISFGTYRVAHNDFFVRAHSTIPVSPGTYRAISEHQVIHNGKKDPTVPYISTSASITIK
jgi:hypothetical protein